MVMIIIHTHIDDHDHNNIAQLPAMIMIFLDNDLHAQLPAGLVPLVGRGGAVDRLAQEEQQLPGQHRPCCLL